MQKEDLREHQLVAVSGLRSGWKAHNNHLINAPCGYGKTALASYITKSFASVGQGVVFVAPYVTLVDQTYKRFEQYGHTDLSIIWRDDPRHDSTALVQIASADTLTRRQWPAHCKIMIWDECHIRRKGLVEILNNPEIHCIGLSATPFPKWLGKYYTNFVKPTTTREMIDIGWLTPFEIYAPCVPDVRGAKMTTNEYGESDYSDTFAEEVMGDAKIIGNILENWLLNGNNEPTIGFAPGVDTANAYTLEFRRVGISAEVITAKTPKDERKVIFERFEAGIVKVIWNVGILGAGFDSDVRCVIWAKLTKSETVWIQGALRGSRPAKGKSKCLLFDHAGTYLRLGDPCDIEYFELYSEDEKVKEAREKQKEERQEKIGKECSCCKIIKQPGEYQCKKCGHKPLAGEFIDGIDETRNIAKVKGGKPEKSMKQKQEFFSQLKGYQLERSNAGKPLSDGYIANTFREWCGSWPNGLSKVPIPVGVEVRNFIKHKNIKWAKSKKRYANS